MLMLDDGGQLAGGQVGHRGQGQVNVVARGDRAKGVGLEFGGRKWQLEGRKKEKRRDKLTTKIRDLYGGLSYEIKFLNEFTLKARSDYSNSGETSNWRSALQ